MSTKKITVILTDRAPVKVDPEQWGTIASCSWGSSAACAAQENERAYLRVRQHDDGRTLVYGSRHEGPRGAPLDYKGAEGGLLLDAKDGPPTSAEIAAAVREVGETIGAERSLIDGCIADLPAEEI